MNPLIEFEDDLSHGTDACDKAEVRLQAVLALFSGEPAEEVQARFHISRSSLYEYKDRALAAMRDALKDKRRGPRQPHNRLAEEKEQSIRSVCERHPTLSSYQVKEQIGEGATTPRTIQRVRKRLHCRDLTNVMLPHSRHTGSRIKKSSSFGKQLNQSFTSGRIASPGICRISTV